MSYYVIVNANIAALKTSAVSRKISNELLRNGNRYDKSAVTKVIQFFLSLWTIKTYVKKICNVLNLE